MAENDEHEGDDDVQLLRPYRHAGADLSGIDRSRKAMYLRADRQVDARKSYCAITSELMNGTPSVTCQVEMNVKLHT